MTDNKTAMQELIHWLQSQFSDRTATDDVAWGREKGFEDAMDKATELLAKEKEQITTAFMEGHIDMTRKEMKYIKPEEYYNTTYSNQ